MKILGNRLIVTPVARKASESLILYAQTPDTAVVKQIGQGIDPSIGKQLVGTPGGKKRRKILHEPDMLELQVGQSVRVDTSFGRHVFPNGDWLISVLDVQMILP